VASSPTVVVSFKDIDNDDRVREAVEERCAALGAEFPELQRVEITLAEGRVGYEVTGHVTGKNEDVGAQASASELRPAAEALLDKLERQVRKHHDKRIFTLRREAQRDAMRRKTS
jgi:ribosomal subunit interface protein